MRRSSQGSSTPAPPPSTVHTNHNFPLWLLPQPKKTSWRRIRPTTEIKSADRSSGDCSTTARWWKNRYARRRLIRAKVPWDYSKSACANLRSKGPCHNTVSKVAWSTRLSQAWISKCWAYRINLQSTNKAAFKVRLRMAWFIVSINGFFRNQPDIMWTLMVNLLTQPIAMVQLSFLFKRTRAHLMAWGLKGAFYVNLSPSILNVTTSAENLSDVTSPLFLLYKVYCFRHFFLPFDRISSIHSI